MPRKKETPFGEFYNRTKEVSEHNKKKIDLFISAYHRFVVTGNRKDRMELDDLLRAMMKMTKIDLDIVGPKVGESASVRMLRKEGYFA